MHTELAQNLHILLSKPSFFLLIAPPAWGKTQLLLELFTPERRWVFVSPLRALANEFASLFSDEEAILIEKSSDWERCPKEKKILVVTPEVFEAARETRCWRRAIFILDEFHLFYRWGESFREKLIEFYQWLASQELTCLALTATMTGEDLSRWQNEMKLNYQCSYKLDVGNLKLKNYPKKCFVFPQMLRSWLVRQIIEEARGMQMLESPKRANLIFVAYRSEVSDWVSRLRKMGLQALGCKGGQTQKFQENLAQGTPHFIVATTAISHGVNLPPIDKIFITYKVEAEDFLVQMVGRGGRKGEDFYYYGLDRIKDVKLQPFWKLLFYDMLARI